MPETMTLAGETPAIYAKTILQRSVCLVLRCGHVGNHRVIKTSAVVEAAGGEAAKVDDTALHTTKRLVSPKVLAPANGLIGQAKSYVGKTALHACDILGAGAYLVPLPLVEAVHEKLQQFRAALAVEAARIAEAYATAVAEQAVALGPLFDASEYPAPADAQAAFRIDWDFVSFAAPEQLTTVDRALFERAQAKYETKMAAAYEEVRLVLRETLRLLTGEIVRKLTPGDDGKPRVFRGTILTDLADFLATFDLRNLTDDGELTAVVDRLHRLTYGVDAEALRDLAGVRATVLAGVREATAQLDGLIATGRRAITFGAVG